MLTAPLPVDEEPRVAALRTLNLLDTGCEPEFDALVNAAAAVCDVPISLISLVDSHRQWFKANHGLQGTTQTPRSVAFCAHTVLNDGILEVPDACLDERFHDNPLVTGTPEIRFYAGAPVRLHSGHRVGTLCVIDTRPRRLNDRQREVLGCLAQAAARAMEGRRAMQQVRSLVSDLSRAAQDARHRASHDPLTGLINRSCFEPRLKSLLDACQLPGAPPAALLCIDLDHFKIVNDTCGHAAGDLLLQRIAAMLRASVRQNDLVARLGGDEFAVLLHACPLPAAHALAERICGQLDAYRFVHGEHRLAVGASIGLAAVDARWASAADLMQAADASCFAAKEAGRNRVVRFSEDQAGIVQRSGDSQWAQRIERALDEDRFVLHGQRIVPLHDRGALEPKLEMLLRMVDADGGLVLPGAFMPSAERYHLMSRIDRWVLRHAIQWLSGLHDRGQAQPLVAVNLSGQSVGDRNFHLWAMAALAAAGPQVCGRLVLEITETVAITNLADAASFVAQVRRLGLRVSLDDFGSGSCSFGYLKALPVDYLKIDGRFVRGLLTDALDAAAVRCFVDVARIAGLKTVAEFVENADVLQRLTDMGVDLAQGFHLHRPQALPQTWVR